MTESPKEPENPRNTWVPSSEPVFERDGERYDKQNRRLCKAHRSDGKLCQSPAMLGSRVCRMHGGAAPQARRKARLRLAELVDPAIATLAREMVKAERSADRQRAANSVLDRAGFSRAQKVQLDDAKAVLRERLRDIRGDQEDGGKAAEEAYDFEGNELVDDIRALELDGAGAKPEPAPVRGDDDDEWED